MARKLAFLKDEKLRRDLRRFYSFVKPYRFRAFLAIGLTTAVGLMGAGIAYLVKVYMDDVILGGSQATSSLFFPMLIIVYAVVESGFQFGSNYFTTWVGRKVSNDIKASLFDKLLHSDPGLFDKTTSGEIFIRYAGDADLASEGLLTNVRTVITRLVTSIGVTVVIVYLSWILALVTVGSLLVTIIPLSRVRRRLKQYIKGQIDSGAQLSTNYTEAYYGNRVVTSYNLYDYVQGRMDRALKTLFRLAIKMVQRTSFLSLVMHAATAFGLAVALWLQGYLIKSGHVTPGEFVSCVTAMFMLYTPIKKVGNNIATIQNCVMAIGRVLEILDRRPKIISRPDAKTLNTVRDGVAINHVNFAYDPGKPVLRDVSLQVKVGTSVALVGSSGGGKSTLVNLIPRFYDVDSGSITIDGIDVRDIELNSLRNLISIVFQDNFLFGGTLRENIMLGNRNATQEQVDAAIKAACLDDFIASLELGLDTHSGERGSLLSGGQKQRVAIARAFLKDASIVILDEATSALDTQSEAVVQQAIENLMHNKTVFIIAHRLSTVINADSIVVIKNGRFVEQGTHSELLARKDSIYASLYRTQLA